MPPVPGRLLLAVARERVVIASRLSTAGGATTPSVSGTVSRNLRVGLLQILRGSGWRIALELAPPLVHLRVVEDNGIPL
jgi:hypothetical protein